MRAYCDCASHHQLEFHDKGGTCGYCGHDVEYDKQKRLFVRQGGEPLPAPAPADTEEVAPAAGRSFGEVEVEYTSATGKTFQEHVSSEVDLDSLVGTFISVGGTRFKVKSYRVLETA